MIAIRLLGTAAALALTVGFSAPAAADFPEKNINFVVPFSPGGGFDVYSRLVAPFLEKHLPNKVNVVIKNVPGAGGRKGLTQVYRARPDGYNIVIVNVPGAMIEPILGKKVQYDLEKITWLGRISIDSYLLGVAKNSSIKTLDDFRKFAASNTVKVPSTGPGSTAYAVTKVFFGVLNVKGEIVTGYEGTKEMTIGLIRGDTPAAVLPVESTRKYVEAGDVRPLIVTEDPNPFKMGKSAKDLGVNDLDGLAIHRLVAAPPGLPANVKKVLETALAEALADPGMKAAAKKANRPLHPLDAAEAEKAVKRELATYLKFKDELAK